MLVVIEILAAEPVEWGGDLPQQPVRGSEYGEAIPSFRCSIGRDELCSNVSGTDDRNDSSSPASSVCVDTSTLNAVPRVPCRVFVITHE